MDLEIKCVTKTNRQDPHERISQIGGLNADKTRWLISQEQTIVYIENRQHTFHTYVQGRRANVIVASRNGRKYIKTENDGEHPNNLLSLASCPI